MVSKPLVQAEYSLKIIEDLGVGTLTPTAKTRIRCVIFECVCGKHFTTNALSVKTKRTRSCGCARKGVNATHGMREHRLYSTWSNIKQRTQNPNSTRYKDYGGRGITLCKEWEDISVFIKDMYPSYEEGLTIDRIDNNRGYNKENCRWATLSEQVTNQRKRTNCSSIYKGVCWVESKNRWNVTLQVDGKQAYVGDFVTEIQAATAYNDYLLLHKITDRELNNVRER